MALKLLDIEYLRSQGTYSGQVVVIGSSQSVTTTPYLVVTNGRVGIGTSVPDQTLSVAGNISIVSSGHGYRFADGSFQSTAAVSSALGGTSGSVQYNNSGQLGGTSNLFWDINNNRLGIGTTIPRSTLQIIDVGYESTNHSTSTMDPIVLDSFSVPDYRSCHYIVQATDSNYSWFHTTQIMLLHDGINAYKSEYNIVTTQDRLGWFDCQINGGEVQLIFTAFYDSDKNIKVIRTSIEP